MLLVEHETQCFGNIVWSKLIGACQQSFVKDCWQNL